MWAKTENQYTPEEMVQMLDPVQAQNGEDAK